MLILFWWVIYLNQVFRWFERHSYELFGKALLYSHYQRRMRMTRQMQL